MAIATQGEQIQHLGGSTSSRLESDYQFNINNKLKLKLDFQEPMFVNKKVKFLSINPLHDSSSKENHSKHKDLDNNNNTRANNNTNKRFDLQPFPTVKLKHVKGKQNGDSTTSVQQFRPKFNSISKTSLEGKIIKPKFYSITTPNSTSSLENLQKSSQNLENDNISNKSQSTSTLNVREGNEDNNAKNLPRNNSTSYNNLTNFTTNTHHVVKDNYSSSSYKKVENLLKQEADVKNRQQKIHVNESVTISGKLEPKKKISVERKKKTSLPKKETLLKIEKTVRRSVKDFNLIKTLGTGTFGRVFLCELHNDLNNKNVYALKALLIPDIIRLNQVEHTNNERSILTKTKHPFIVTCHETFADDRCLYMLLEYAPGGELFTYLRNVGRFNSPTTLFYTVEIICVLEYLHSQKIVYRDLKPENLLLDRRGHLKFTDFGFAKELNDITWTLCGTPEYLSPEIIQGKGHEFACDWWTLGILCYEMLVGEAPFVDAHPFGLYEKILAGKITWPEYLENTTPQDFIAKLIVVDRSSRLGKGQNGSESVKKHRWFSKINWNNVLNKTLKSPFQPTIADERDTCNFDVFEEDWSLDITEPASLKECEKFKEWFD